MDQELKQFIFYVSPEGKVAVDVFVHDETVWLTQKKMSQLFSVQVPAISKHLSNIFEEGELVEQAVVSILETTAEDGKVYKTQYYNLDAIISVGYRINSAEATHFRKWATTVLRNFIIKGFAIDDELLKNGARLGKDYFHELLERIRDIRASERRFYQKITDIYATAVDYDATTEVTQTFFKAVQNKLHYATHGHTAAEVITERANARKPNMGLSTWKKSPDGKVMKTDVSVAKNYLTEEEVSTLNRVVTMYLDYAEDQAGRGKTMTMAEWKDKLDAFLQFNDREVLDNPGKVKAEVARKFAEEEYEKFRPIQDKAFKSDFDKFVEETKKLEDKDPGHE
ncbi:MAG: virulence RhuM family protein [bacterium]|nr:virulence RhuM family protein [bacterium]